MDKFIRLTPDQRSNLVAYLDGELGERATTEIELVLAQSTIARNDIEMLARTYDLLEELPRGKATQEFTERTLASVRMDQARPDITQTEWYKRARRGSVFLGWTLAMVAASLAGYVITQRLVPNESDLLVRDYDVIEQLDRYREAGSLDFVAALADQNPTLLNEIRSEAGRETR